MSRAKRTLIIYDSYFGNTQAIAEAMAKAIDAEGLGPAKAVKVNSLNELNADLKRNADPDDIGMLIIGSPTRAFRPTKPVMDFIKGLDVKLCQGMRVAVFDTRCDPADIKQGLVRGMMKTFGFAAEPMAKALKAKGCILSGENAINWFIVKDQQGPLKDGEVERAAKWGVELGKA